LLISVQLSVQTLIVGETMAQFINDPFRYPIPLPIHQKSSWCAQ